ncbi:MAG: PorT family protein [Cyclobacteriaceae bacterium]|nr:PorT family protein [Cyclobacteriaceae bacterium]
MKRRLYIFLGLFLITASAWCQQEKNYELPKSRRIIDEVELIAGLSVNIPNDNGFSERLRRSSLGNILDSYNSKIGYSLGIGVAHTIGRRTELNAFSIWERRGFIQENLSLGGANIIKYVGDLRINYLSLALTSKFYFSDKKRIYTYSGFYYSWLFSSFRKETLFINNQSTQGGSITDDPNLKDDFGLTLGLGYSIPVSNKYLHLRLQGNYGLAKIMDINSLVINNNSIFFVLTYSIIKKSKL